MGRCISTGHRRISHGTTMARIASGPGARSGEREAGPGSLTTVSQTIRTTPDSSALSGRPGDPDLRIRWLLSCGQQGSGNRRHSLLINHPVDFLVVIPCEGLLAGAVSPSTCL